MLQVPSTSVLHSSFIQMPLGFRPRDSICSNRCLNFACGQSSYRLFSKSMDWRIRSRKISRSSLKLGAGKEIGDLDSEEGFSTSFDWDDQGKLDTEDEGSPWKDAIIYRRNSSVFHVEYCTTLERLGLGKLSTEVSKSRASVMGLRVTKAVKDYPNGTPALVSLDVTRRKQRLRLDGILRTIITLGCNRCGEPAAKTVFTNFSLLLTEEPIEEPEMILVDLTHREGKPANGSPELGDEDEDDSIDIDDWLYFPIQEKEIDISKHIRDLIHLEITIAEVCDPQCKGLCLGCGVNLNNNNSCKCKRMEADTKGFGPLGSLRKQMQQK